jgi:hypothetical protein
MGIDRRYYDYNRHGGQVDIEEAMANEFADKLLMREDLFQKAIETEKNIGKLAEMFEVPASAVKRRALSLGYNLKKINKMETRKLEFKDIAGYLPYELYSKTGRTGLIPCLEYLQNPHSDRIVLRPLSDLYRTITHNGKEIIPIVEMQQMWSGEIPYNGGIVNYEKIINKFFLFDYLHELKIDYRGLIDAGLAIDMNTLNENPYK